MRQSAGQRLLGVCWIASGATGSYLLLIPHRPSFVLLGDETKAISPCRRLAYASRLFGISVVFVPSDFRHKSAVFLLPDFGIIIAVVVFEYGGNIFKLILY